MTAAAAGKEVIQKYLTSSSSSSSDLLDDATVSYLLEVISDLSEGEETEDFEETACLLLEYKKEAQALAADENENENEVENEDEKLKEEARRCVREVKGLLDLLRGTKGIERNERDEVGVGVAEKKSNTSKEDDIIADMKGLLSKVHSFQASQSERETRDERESESFASEKALGGEELRNNVETLKSIAGNSCSILDSTLETVLLEKCGGDLSSAVLWITENDLKTFENLLISKRKAKEAELQDSKENNQKIFEQYGLRPVSNNGGHKGKGPGKGSNKQQSVLINGPQGLKGAGKTEKAPKLRYHNDQVVTNSGQKYVVVTDKDEWDGGSRGKVITKGKRGKGFT